MIAASWNCGAYSGPGPTLRTAEMARPSRTLAGTGAGTAFVATSEKAYPAVNAHGANDNATASAGLVSSLLKKRIATFGASRRGAVTVPKSNGPSTADTQFFALSREPDSNSRPRHQVILWSCLVDFGGSSPLELTGFRTSGNLSHGTGRTTNLPPLRGLLDPSAATRWQGTAHVPVLCLRWP